MASGGTLCHFYYTAKGCRNGDQCRFIHGDGCETLAVQPAMSKCRYYRAPGDCRYGESCYFLHDDPVDEQKGLCEEIRAGCVVEKKLGGDKSTTVEENDDVYDNEASNAEKEVEMGSDESSGLVDVEDASDSTEEEIGSDDCSGFLDSEEEAEKRFDEWKKKMEELEKPRPDISMAKCSSCEYKTNGEDAFDKLADHYYEKLLKNDFKHRVFTSSPQRRESTTCLLCDRYFGSCGSLLRHILDKTKRTDKDGKDHMLLVTRGILQFICFRDIDHHDNAVLDEELSRTLVQDTFEDHLAEAFGYAMMSGGYGGFGSDDDNDGDFFGSDQYELLCQGIKPWDPEAGAALAVLNGW